MKNALALSLLCVSMVATACDDSTQADRNIDLLQSVDTNEISKNIGKADVIDQDEYSIGRIESGTAIGDVFLVLPEDVKCEVVSGTSNGAGFANLDVTIERVFDKEGFEIPLDAPLDSGVFGLPVTTAFGESFASCDPLDEKLGNTDVLVGFWDRCLTASCEGSEDPSAEHIYRVFYHSFE